MVEHHMETLQKEKHFYARKQMELFLDEEKDQLKMRDFLEKAL